jgi:hypothetical protein
LKPGFHFIGSSRVETRRFQAMGQQYRLHDAPEIEYFSKRSIAVTKCESQVCYYYTLLVQYSTKRTGRRRVCCWWRQRSAARAADALFCVLPRRSHYLQWQSGPPYLASHVSHQAAPHDEHVVMCISSSSSILQAWQTDSRHPSLSLALGLARHSPVCQIGYMDHAVRHQSNRVLTAK